MKVLVVSWEYPPVVVGGLGRHVHHLAEALAEHGLDVTVLTRQPPGTDSSTHPTTDTVVNGVRVVAAAEDPPEFDFGADMMAWTLAMGHGFIRTGLRYLRGTGDVEPWRPDVVHAHDWLVAHPSIALAEYFDVPLVATLHATEAGRHSGWVAGPVNRQVHSVEWWLANSADALITCSTSMRDEVQTLFGPDLPPVTVIHNGIDLSAWAFGERPGRSRPPELLFAGRLEYEKGVQDLLAALPVIRHRHPGTTLTVAGEGTQLAWLTETAAQHGVTGAVTFVGKQDHRGLAALMQRCSAIVLPSRYEPFGIVALEAAASGIPLVASDAGGLGEAVLDGETGLTFPPADVPALAGAVCAALDEPEAAALRARRARAVLTEDFTWPVIAERTAAVYRVAPRRPDRPLARPHIPVRPLPERDPNK